MYVGEWTSPVSNEMKRRTGFIQDSSPQNRPSALLVKRPSKRSGRPDPIEGRISLGIRAFDTWRIAGAGDAHSPFRIIRYWLCSIGLFFG